MTNPFGPFQSPPRKLGEPQDNDTLYTIDEVAERLRVSVRTVRRWITEKKIKAHKLGRPGAPKAAVRLSESEIQRFLKEGPR